MGKPTRDFSAMLPSEARRAIVAEFLFRLVSGGLSWRADPLFTYEDAFEVVRPEQGATFLNYQLVAACWQEALAEYNRRHPKGWDNENQKAFREGLGYG